MAAGPNAGDLRPLLEGLTRAESEDDLARARKLRLAILRRRVADRAAGVLGGASQLDFALLDRVVHDLQRNREHELALQVAAAGRGLARRAGDAAQERWFLVLGALSCIKLLDLAAAEQALEMAIGRRADAAAVEALGAAPLGYGEDAAALRIRTLDVCGRLMLAQGRSAAAEQAARSALELALAGPPARISVPDLALRHAEVLLERGDFAGMEQLRAEHQARRHSRRVACHWALLRANSLILRGHLSEAEEVLQSLGKGPQPLGALELLEEARAMRANLLGVLNKTGQARQALRGDELQAQELLRFERMLQGRESVMDGVGRMPVPMDRRPRPRLGNDSARAPAFSASAEGRRYENARAEWGWRAGEVLLALDSGAAEAAELFERVDRFAARIESPLIRAKHALLRALVLQHSGHWAEAAACADGAASQLLALDLPRDELSARQVVRSALLRGGARPGDDRVRAAREAIERALGTVRDRLRGADKVIALLNLWSEVDEGISARCLAIGEEVSGPWWRRSRLSRRLTRAALTMALEEKRWPDVGGAPPPAEGSGERGAVGAAVRQVGLRSRGGSGGDVHSLLELPSALLPRDLAAVVYLSLPDRLEMFVLTRSGCVRMTPGARAARGALWEFIRTAAAELHYRNPWGPGGNLGALERVAACLGLPELLEALPARVTRVCVVPDDAIVHVPFAALPVGGEPFLRRWSTAFLPLAGWTSRRPVRRLSGGLGVAVERSAVLPESDLSHAALEVESMRSAVPGGVSLVGAAASRENVLRQLQDADAVHFSCHGRFDPEHPHLSALACADGWLSIEDILRVSSSHLHLAVLGACWGAQTFVLPGRELINLPTAFLDAGAVHAVASLWKVGDQSSADFARELYGGDVTDPAAAVRRVQLAWFGSRSPREWAPWVVYQRGMDPGWLGRGYLRWRRAVQGLARSLTS